MKHHQIAPSFESPDVLSTGIDIFVVVYASKAVAIEKFISLLTAANIACYGNSAISDIESEALRRVQLLSSSSTTNCKKIVLVTPPGTSEQEKLILNDFCSLNSIGYLCCKATDCVSEIIHIIQFR